MKVLISSLGETPSVVTETIDALERERIRIDLVITIGTSEWSVMLSQDVLQEELRKLDIDYISDLIEAKDLLSEKDHFDYLDRVLLWLRQYQRHDVYLSLAGGRKTMSALLTLAAQIYGAQMLCHVVPMDEELERLGQIRTFMELAKDEQKRVLHPLQEKIHFIRFPFISLFPLREEIIKGLRGGAVSSEVRKLLETNRMIESGRVNELGQKMLKILESVETLPEPRTGQCLINIADGEPQEIEVRRRWASKIEKRFSFVTRIDEMGWREGQPKVKTESPNCLVLFVPGHRISGIGFRLTTTAKTAGELQRAKQEIERWLDKEV